MGPVVLLNLGELVLKGGNRKIFETKLMQNARLAFDGMAVSFSLRFGRIIVAEEEAGALADRELVCERLTRLYGVARIQYAQLLPLEYDELERYTLANLTFDSSASFAVRAKRSNKQFPISSMEIERQLGAAVAERTGASVNLSNPDKTIEVIVTEDAILLVQESVVGAGGLPVGTSGKVLSLLSSGIDSPVASARMMRRGATVFYLHFHSYPMTSRESIENTKEIVSRLQAHQPQSKLLLAPLLSLQQAVVKGAPPELRIVLYRRAMYQIADLFAHRLNAQALTTGESLGQVASQTIRNMTVTSSGLKRPIFRPLVGMDKEEIVREARDLGTYDVSIRPYEDCCSLLAPSHVETHAELSVVEEIERSLPWEELKAQVIAETELLKVGASRS